MATEQRGDDIRLLAAVPDANEHLHTRLIHMPFFKGNRAPYIHKTGSCLSASTALIPASCHLPLRLYTFLPLHFEALASVERKSPMVRLGTLPEMQYESEEKRGLR